MNLKQLIKKIDTLKNQIDKLRPLDPDLERQIMQKLRFYWNFHSNSLEGNSLTLGETKVLLLHGLTASGKPLKDHLEITGHNEAILLLDEVVKEKRPLTETFIREMHKIILKEPYYIPAITPDGIPTQRQVKIGQYKTTPNYVLTKSGETFYFASPEETPAKMNDLMDWYKKFTGNIKMHPVELASQFHYKIILIHPFDDGNGRISRIFMNLILMMKGFIPIIIKTQNKDDYFHALRQADGSNIDGFNEYISIQLLRSLELYLQCAKSKSSEKIDKEFGE